VQIGRNFTQISGHTGGDPSEWEKDHDRAEAASWSRDRDEERWSCEASGSNLALAATSILENCQNKTVKKGNNSGMMVDVEV